MLIEFDYISIQIKNSELNTHEIGPDRVMNLSPRIDLRNDLLHHPRRFLIGRFLFYRYSTDVPIFKLFTVQLFFCTSLSEISKSHPVIWNFCSAQHESPRIQAYPAVKMLKMFQQEKYFEIYQLLLNPWWLDQIFRSKSLIDAGELTG